MYVHKANEAMNQYFRCRGFKVVGCLLKPVRPIVLLTTRGVLFAYRLVILYIFHQYSCYF